MLTVHHLDKSRSQRILWLLEELGEDYEIVEHKRNPKTMRAPKALREVHPLGKSPVIVLDDGTVIAESGVIIEEMLDRHDGALRPERGTDAYRRYRYFLHYAEATLMPPLLVKLIFHQVRNAPVPFFLKPIGATIADKVDATYTDPEIDLHLRFLDDELANRTYIVGEDLTGADIQLLFPLQGAQTRASFDGKYDHVHRYVEALESRPAYQRAIDRGGPLNLDKM